MSDNGSEMFETYQTEYLGLAQSVIQKLKEIPTCEPGI